MANDGVLIVKVRHVEVREGLQVQVKDRRKVTYRLVDNLILDYEKGEEGRIRIKNPLTGRMEAFYGDIEKDENVAQAAMGVLIGVARRYDMIVETPEGDRTDEQREHLEKLVGILELV